MHQTYDDLDVIAIDDGSTDGTRTKLDALLTEFPKGFRWIGGERRGACAARNAGLAITQGEYVQFLDADDAVLTDKLHRQVDLANALGMPDLIVGDFRNVYEDGTEETISGLGRDPWMALISTQLGTTSANLFKRSALEAVGAWNVEQVSSQDYELMFRMLANGAAVAWDPHVSSLVLKRSSGSISRTGQRENWIRYLNLRREIREYLRGLGGSTYAREIEEANQHIFMAIRVLSRHDPEAARKEFKRNLPGTFVPDRTAAITPSYIAFYKLFGFRVAQRSAMVLGLFKGSKNR
jgi:glycosyltransferase involved in cell wall biosynthesis